MLLVYKILLLAKRKYILHYNYKYVVTGSLALIVRARVTAKTTVHVMKQQEYARVPSIVILAGKDQVVAKVIPYISGLRIECYVVSSSMC